MDLTSTPVVCSLRPGRRRGFPADLSLGFYLYAQERMTYVWASEPRRCGWRTHRFVAFDGRLIRIELPPKAKLFVWRAGLGPRPQDSVSCRTSIWGRVPPSSLAGWSFAELNCIFGLWEQYGHAPSIPSIVPNFRENRPNDAFE